MEKYQFSDASRGEETVSDFDWFALFAIVAVIAGCAEAELLARNPGKTKADIHLSFHCYDEDCEDCFGQ